MRFVGSRGAEREDVDVAILKEEVHPVSDSDLRTTDGTAVDHLDAVVVADEERVFHITFVDRPEAGSVFRVGKSSGAPLKRRKSSEFRKVK